MIKRPGCAWRDGFDDKRQHAETLGRDAHRGMGDYVVAPLDRRLYHWSNGRFLTTGRPLAPTLLLTTTGRGKPRRKKSPAIGRNWCKCGRLTPNILPKAGSVPYLF